MEVSVMRARTALTLAVVVVGIGFGLGSAWSQDKPPTPEEMEKMMAAMAEMAVPAEQHKQLNGLAGTWDCEMTHLMPGSEPMKMKGVTTWKAAMGNLYMVADHKSEMMGKPFEGLAVDGYSKEKKKFFTFWADSMGSTPMLLWGTAEGKTITYDGDEYDCGPMGKMVPRTKVTFDDADHITFEFWAKMGAAPEYGKMMEGKYTRRK
jgi:hypothetical protein